MPLKVLGKAIKQATAKKFVAAYEAAGFRKLNRLDHKVWPVLLFVKL